jgi:hypothetical protein
MTSSVRTVIREVKGSKQLTASGSHLGHLSVAKDGPDICRGLRTNVQSDHSRPCIGRQNDHLDSHSSLPEFRFRAGDFDFRENIWPTCGMTPASSRRHTAVTGVTGHKADNRCHHILQDNTRQLCPLGWRSCAGYRVHKNTSCHDVLSSP